VWRTPRPAWILLADEDLPAFEKWCNVELVFDVGVPGYYFFIKGS
jgi:hypothetical protein